MIPIGDDNPTKTVPYITYALIAVNILVYLIDRIGAHGEVGNLWNLSMVPQAIMKNKDVLVPVARTSQGQILTALYQGLNPKWLTIFSSMFMHGGIMHIAGNMLYLWIFGNNIEDALGHFAFILFYFAAGFIAALAHILTNINSTIPLVGASGAIAGVLGAYFYLFPKSKVRTLVFLGIFWTFVEIPAVIVLGFWFVSQLLNLMGSSGSLGGGVAYAAHIGGFVAGLALILIMGGKSLLRKINKPRIDSYVDWRN